MSSCRMDCEVVPLIYTIEQTWEHMRMNQQRSDTLYTTNKAERNRMHILWDELR